MSATACGSCGQPIVWLVHERTGRHAPIDRDPNPDGPCVVDLDAGTYRVLTKDELTHPEIGDAAPLRRTNHFQTCPHRHQWRRRR